MAIVVFPATGLWSSLRSETRHPGLTRRVTFSVHATSVSASPTLTPKKNRKRPQNVKGDFYVDERCIDCDVCRWMAPSTFKRMEWKSAVFKQPETPEERVAALQALLSCPVKSIHTEKPPSDILGVHSTFPIPIDNTNLPGVYHCGYHSDKSFGGTPYLIQHPDGNILVDSPSFKEKLATKIDALGGVRFMFLTHRDDVADHDKWARRFSCERVMHVKEVQAHTAGVERKLEGEGPWRIHPDVDLIFTPGHTEGSVSLFYKPQRVLFTGDHLAATPNGHLTHFEKYNHYSGRMVALFCPFFPLGLFWDRMGQDYIMKRKLHTMLNKHKLKCTWKQVPYNRCCDQFEFEDIDSNAQE